MIWVPVLLQSGIGEFQIDAVCIDQSQVVEKSWQIAQMGQIFARATRTLVFLGPANVHSKEATCLLQQTGEEVIACGWNGFSWYSIVPQCKDAIVEEYKQGTTLSENEMMMAADPGL
jgi:hypothetical protein